MKGSLDLENARTVAKHINSKHHEIILTEDEFFKQYQRLFIILKVMIQQQLEQVLVII